MKDLLLIHETMRGIAFFSSLTVIVVGMFSIDFGMAGIGLMLAVVAMSL